jgi:membrane associated rhomboid family serine protease
MTPEPSSHPHPDRGPLDPHVPPPVMPTPLVCYAVIGLSVGMFFLFDNMLPRTMLPELGGTLRWGALYGPLVQQGEWWRVLGTAIEHGGPIHLLFNMSVVWTMGTTLERSMGSGRFLLLSLITALGSSFFVLLFAFDSPTVGASGMILGWGGCMLPISTREGRKDLFIWLAQILVISLLPGISWQGHLGGFLFGLPVGFALRMGPRRFRLIAPILLLLAAAATVLAANPERFSR